MIKLPVEGLLDMWNTINKFVDVNERHYPKIINGQVRKQKLFDIVVLYLVIYEE